MYTQRARQLSVLAIVLLVGMIGIQSVCGAEAEEERILSAARSYVKTELIVTKDWLPSLSRRWRKAISDETNTALISTFSASLKEHPVNFGLNSIKVAKCNADTAVVEYEISGVDSPGHMRHMYLVKEDGNWLVDSLLCHTPEWAVPSESKKVHADILKMLNEFYSLHCSGDITKNQEFMNEHFSSEALIEQSPEHPMGLRDSTRRPLSPASLSVRLIQEGDGVKTVQVSAAQIWSFRDRTGKETVRMGVTGYTFIEQDGQWKFLNQQRLLPYQIVLRYLEVWQQGKADIMSQLMTPDSIIDLGNGAGKKWGEIKNDMPKIASSGNYSDVIDNAIASGLYADIKFAKNSKIWHSGKYKFLTGYINKQGMSWTRIKAIQYVGKSSDAAP